MRHSSVTVSYHAMLSMDAVPPDRILNLWERERFAFIRVSHGETSGSRFVSSLEFALRNSAGSKRPKIKAPRDLHPLALLPLLDNFRTPIGDELEE